LPQGCTPFQNGGNCFGTFHFTIHRVKANAPLRPSSARRYRGFAFRPHAN
jgi:hypothetical protein